MIRPIAKPSGLWHLLLLHGVGMGSTLRYDRDRLEIVARHPSILPHELTEGGILASRGYELLYGARTGGWTRVGRVPQSEWRRLLSRLTVAGQALRLGLHAAARLRSGHYLAVVNGGLLRSADGYNFETILAFDHFRKPAREGFLVDRRERIFLAQYTRNPDRMLPIRLWRSDDGGRRFEVVHCFEPGLVRHIHFVKEDPVDGALWMGTGDRDSECGIYRSIDGGERWEVVGHGGQAWRATSLAFLPDGIYWGTDAGCDAGEYQNRILRLDRKGGRLEEQERVQGPVHAISALRGGRIVLATGVEGGANEHDDRVHLWFSQDGSRWTEIASFAAGLQPRRVQYALAHFVPGQEVHENLYLVLRGVAGMALGFLEARILQ